MEKIIIYGNGVAFQQDKEYIEHEYEVVGFIDENPERSTISINDLGELNFDKIYISSLKYEDEIRTVLNKHGFLSDIIITRNDMWWKEDNETSHHEWIINQLKEIPNGLTILDAGAGEEKYKKYCSHLRYISQDFGEYDEVDKTKTGLHPANWNSKRCDIISDITDIPLESGSVDVILCVDVFEHIPNPILAVKEFSRLLKKGGILLLAAPQCSLTHFAPFFYADGFSRFWYIKHLVDAGFEIDEMKENGNYFSYMKQELMRTSLISEKYAVKIDKSVLLESIKLFDRLSMIQDGSEELLCFGRLVKAVKK